MTPQFTINGYELHGGGACPEQYDVYKGGKEVGYLRLWWRTFRVEAPFGNTICSFETEGHGCFDPEERMLFLTKGVMAIDQELNKNQ